MARSSGLGAFLNREEEKTDFKQIADWLEGTQKKNNISKPFKLEFCGKDSEPEPGTSRHDYARYEAVAVRYAFQKSGYAMPAAAVTAKGRFIYVVTFPDADSRAEKWDVKEFEIRAGQFAKDPSNEKALLNSFKEAQRGTGSSHQLITTNFETKINQVKQNVYDDCRERAKGPREKTRTLTPTPSGPYVDGTVAVTGDFVMERKSLGRVPTFYSPNDAQEEFIATLDQEGRFVRRKDRKKDDPDYAKFRRRSLSHVMEEARSAAADYELDSEVLASCLIEHVQSQFLLDMFSKDGGLPLSSIDVEVSQKRDRAGGSSDVNNDDSSGNQPRLPNAHEDDSDFDFSAAKAGLDSKDKVIFSRAWKFDNEYDDFYTNWISGWYLSKLIQTGHRYDAETTLIFYF
jgi:hypothetical protein